MKLLFLCVVAVFCIGNLTADASPTDRVLSSQDDVWLQSLVRIVDQEESDIPVNCMLCEFVVDEFKKNLLPNITSRGQLQNETYALCFSILHNKTQCAMVAPLLASALWSAKTTSSRKSCEILKVCPSTKLSQAPSVLDNMNTKLIDSVKPQVGDIPVKCMWCELAVDLVDKNVLPNIKNESELQQNITNLCEKLLPNNKTLCLFVGPMVAKYLWNAKNASPRKACEMLKVCPKSYVFRDIISKNGTNGALCTACKGLVDVVKTAVLANISWVENEVISIFCDHLPPTPMQSCIAAIKADLPADIEKYLDATAVCGLLKAC